MKNIIIKEIEDKSIAEELGIEPGDVLLTINGITPADILEYRYLINDEFLLMEIQKPDGEIWQIDIEKDYDESIGLIFVEEIIDKPKSCHNHCIFCFIDQLPEGLRDTLYFKDDDTRLSFLHGNYVTLTNLSEEEINRIIKYRIQPINISVHTTNPALRVEMLGNKKASNINLILKKFYNHGIQMNIQIVLIPEYNDGVALDYTLKELMQLYPYVKSVSIVPVGLSKYRKNLKPLRTFTSHECKDVIILIKKYQERMKKKSNNNLIYPSDEFFIKGKLSIPNPEYYDDFLQLENGVGMMSLFYHESMESIDHKYIGVKSKEVHIVTGVLSKKYIDDICEKIMIKYPQVLIHVHAIKNCFFGDDITVSGLITGEDIIKQLQGIKPQSNIIIPENMLRFETDQLLDDMTIQELEQRLQCNVIPIKIEGSKFIEKILY